MAADEKKWILFILAGAGIGLVASLAIRFVAGFFMKIPVDFASLASFGIAGLIMGAYFGYVLFNFNYDALYKHTDKDKKP